MSDAIEQAWRLPFAALANAIDLATTFWPISLVLIVLVAVLAMDYQRRTNAEFLKRRERARAAAQRPGDVGDGSM